MRPLKERFCIVLWVIWIIWSSAMIIGIGIEPYATAKSRTYTYTENHPESLPKGIIDAYKSGQMTPIAMQELESDLRREIVVPGPGESVTIPPEYPSLTKTLIYLSGSILIPAIIFLLLQYLITGIASPRELVRKNHQKNSI